MYWKTFFCWPNRGDNHRSAVLKNSWTIGNWTRSWEQWKISSLFGFYFFFFGFRFSFLFSSSLCAIWTHASERGIWRGAVGRASSKHITPKGFVSLPWRSGTNTLLSFIAFPSGQRCKFGSRYTSRYSHNSNLVVLPFAVLPFIFLFFLIKAKIWCCICVLVATVFEQLETKVRHRDGRFHSSYKTLSSNYWNLPC